MSSEIQFRFCTMLMVLPSLILNTDHVIGLELTANHSYCNLSYSAMGFVLAVVGTRLLSAHCKTAIMYDARNLSNCTIYKKQKVF